jgi:hypothetical protein
VKLYYEWGTRQVNKHGEELCGDSLSVRRHGDYVTVALSDGLGSGVKANILATLTTSIATALLENGLALDEVVQTLSETLPVCEVRKLAYSTFVLAHFPSTGNARFVEFDAPPAILLRQQKTRPLVYEEHSVEGKVIRESVVDLDYGDWVVFVSDGVLNAGIGGAYPLGWGWEQTTRFLEERVRPGLGAQEVADRVAETVNDLYVGAPGDDVSVIVIKARHKLSAIVFTGPPLDAARDEAVVAQFVRFAGRHAVCGGTTAQIVSRYLGQPMEVDLTTMTEDVPPTARMEHMDLVTEGILTLTRVNEMLRSGTEKKAVQYRTDGAAALLRLLLEVDHVHFLVGQTVNPAHQNPELPHQLEIRMAAVREIAEALRRRGMEVTLESA